MPLAGSFKIRQGWRNFRRRFSELRFKPVLNYEAVRETDSKEEIGLHSDTEYRFTGTFEFAEDNILWVRNDELTIPVDLKGAKAYLLPNDPDEDIPEKIRWNQLSILSGEVRIYVGGTLALRDKRRIFASSPGSPLLIILYEGSDHTLTTRTIKGGRYKNKYWNFITPYAHIMGAFSQIIMAVYLFDRPARRNAMIAAFIALFAPIIPLIPPGILFAMLYRRLWWRARLCRAYRDLARLLFFYTPKNETGAGPTALNEKGIKLPDGEFYGMKQYDTLPPAFYEKGFPFIIPETEKKKGDKWHVFGIRDDKKNEGFLSAPADPLTVYGAIPGEPEILSKRYAVRAWSLEILSWIVFAAGLAINLAFIRAVLFMTGVFSG
ncbi:MAG: hypothetical protein LBH43_20185 [Treponema sp.]|jgi:hypothetical protein|nr:hypothetical protein [Treponema sp.]